MGISFHQILRSSRAFAFFCFFFISPFNATPLFADEFSLVEERVEAALDSLIEQGYPFAEVTPSVDSQGVLELKLIPGKQYARLSIEQHGSTVRSYLFDGLVSPYRSFKTLVTGISPFQRYLEYSSITDSVQIGGLYQRGDTLVMPISIVPQKDFFLNGVIGYSNQGDQGVSGDFSISLRNSFGFGEEVAFSYKGDKRDQQIGAALQLPYLFSMPLLFNTTIEVEVSEETGFVTLNSALSYLLPSLQEIGIGYDHYQMDREKVKTDYSGVLLYIKNKRALWEKGKFIGQYGITLSTGLRSEIDKHYYVNMKGSIGGQVPIRSMAIKGSADAGFIKSDAPNLKEQEKFRLGGSDLMRGYSSKSIPVISYGVSEMTYVYYISRYAALYVTNELAIKTGTSLSFNDLSFLYDYGIGFTYPVRKVQFNIELMKAVDEPFRNARIRVNITKR